MPRCDCWQCSRDAIISLPGAVYFGRSHPSIVRVYPPGWQPGQLAHFVKVADPGVARAGRTSTLRVCAEHAAALGFEQLTIEQEAPRA